MISPELSIRGLLAVGILALPSAPLSQEGSLGTAPDPHRTVIELSDPNTGSVAPVTAAEYTEWLVRHRGQTMVERFTRSLLVESMAARDQASVTPEEVSASVEREFRRRIQRAFGGKREAWKSELKSLGRSERGLRIERGIEHRTKLLLEKLLADNRNVPESALRAEWESQYGAEGVRPTLRVMQFQTASSRRRGTPDADAVQRAENEARARAAAAHARLISGAEFARVASEVSDDDGSRLNGGLAADDFSVEGWPPASAAIVDALSVGEFTAPIEGPHGFWIVQLVERVTTDYESVREEIEARMLAEPPSSAEVDAFLEALYGSVEPEVLDELHRGRGLHEPALPRDAAVLRIGERSVTRAELGSWIMRVRGESYVERFALWWKVERLADEEKVELAPGAVTARVESDRQLMIETGFHGKEEDWLADLESKGRTFDSWQREAGLRTRTNMLCEELLIRERVITAEQVRLKWEEDYGPGGLGLYARSLLVQPTPPEFQPGLSTEEITALVESAFGAAERQAKALTERVRAGEDFGALARQFSDDEENRESGGLLPGRFDARDWSKQAGEAVAALAPGEVTDPVRFSDAYVIFELLDRRETPLESVREQLEKELRSARPNEPELAAFRNLAQQQAVVKILPAFYL